MNELRAIYTIWRREGIRYIRDKARIFSTLLQPLMFLVIFGAGLGGTLNQGNFGIDFMKFMYPGIIAMNVMGIAFFSTVSTVWDREFGFLKEILVAPISRTSIVIGKILGAVTVASTQAWLLLVLAPFMGISLHIFIVVKLFLFMVLLAFAISGMGLFIASRMKTTESFGIIMQVLIFPMFFLSGAFFPLTNVPLWMTILSRFNPLTYGVDAMRQIILNGLPAELAQKLFLYPIEINILALSAFSVFMVLIATLAFNKRN
ncbi:ABC transporter permease [Candidatus Falkowbacteria bacterium]|nr:ABC transporter permease [Candidatus Falkowbacteria bacterium]